MPTFGPFHPWVLLKMVRILTGQMYVHLSGLLALCEVNPSVDSTHNGPVMWGMITNSIHREVQFQGPFALTIFHHCSGIISSRLRVDPMRSVTGSQCLIYFYQILHIGAKINCHLASNILKVIFFIYCFIFYSNSTEICSQGSSISSGYGLVPNATRWQAIIWPHVWSINASRGLDELKKLPSPFRRQLISTQCNIERVKMWL